MVALCESRIKGKQDRGARIVVTKEGVRGRATLSKRLEGKEMRHESDEKKRSH
jgi:hypothetical protein